MKKTLTTVAFRGTEEQEKQLYAVIDELKDVPGALKKVAEMGYEGVEFAGYYGFDNNPKELRKMLDDVGLKATSTHIGFGAIQGDALKKSAEIAHALGFNKLIVPGGLEGRMRASHDSNKQIAEEMSKCAEEAAAEEAPAEEPVAEEVIVEAPAEEEAPVADDADFEG